MRASEVFNVSQSSTISLKRGVDGPLSMRPQGVSWGSGFVLSGPCQAAGGAPRSRMYSCLISWVCFAQGRLALIAQ